MNWEKLTLTSTTRYMEEGKDIFKVKDNYCMYIICMQV